MATEKKVRQEKTPSLAFALISFIAIIVVLIVMINMGVNTPLTMFVGSLMAGLVAFILNVKWEKIEKTIVTILSDCLVTFLIVIMVGMLVGIWMASGTVPAVMYYGMKLISPKIMLPLTFALCCFTSLFTGTSMGSIATVGLAMMSIASTTSLPMPLVVGAIASGAYFGDKMSPMSDTTNLAAGISHVGLYDHISSMNYTTWPATGICLVLYTIAGLVYSGGAVDVERANLLSNTLAANFNISIFLILPAILVLLVSVFKMPALLGMSLTVVISCVFAMVFQGVNFVDLLNYAYNGFSIETGVAIVDPMLNRGGIVSFTELLVVYILATTMGAIITSAGLMDVIAKKFLLKVIKNRTMLVGATLLYGYVMNFVAAGSQTIVLIVTAQTFQEAYDEMNISRKVLSRSLEDAGTLGCVIVPWGITAVFITSVLDTTTAYIPYAWLVFIVPIFSIICAATGIGMWDSAGNPLWNKREKKKAQSA